MTAISGGCFCGAVRYQADGSPSSSMICHCQSCRRTSGAPAVAWVTFEKSQFKLTRGVPNVLKSSPPVRRTFCISCGTPLTFESERFPTSIDVTTCSLDEPNAFPPTHHAWLSHDVCWLKFGDDLPGFAEFRTESS